MSGFARLEDHPALRTGLETDGADRLLQNGPCCVIHNVERYGKATAMQIEVKKIGNSTGFILPKELATRLRLEPGDTMIVSETPTGITLSRGDAEFDRVMEIARAGMKRYRNALAELAK